MDGNICLQIIQFALICYSSSMWPCVCHCCPGPCPYLHPPPWLAPEHICSRFPETPVLGALAPYLVYADYWTHQNDFHKWVAELGTNLLDALFLLIEMHFPPFVFHSPVSQFGGNPAQSSRRDFKIQFSSHIRAALRTPTLLILCFCKWALVRKDWKFYYFSLLLPCIKPQRMYIGGKQKQKTLHFSSSMICFLCMM